MKIDAGLKEMLEKLDFVKSARAFKRWRSSFLAKFESFLEESNIAVAQAAYEAFHEHDIVPQAGFRSGEVC
jgi:hypothetical protein